MNNIQKIVFYVFMLFLCKPSYTQDYISFPSSNAQWGIEFEWEGEESIEYTRLNIVGDTLLNGLEYVILKQNKAIYFPFRLNKWEYYSLPNVLYREEEKKIFLYEFLYNQEYLYYDFNLQVNDTFVFKSTDSLLVVKEIELFGRKGIRLKRLNNPYLGNYITVDWLQEMGSLNGLLYPAGINAAISSLDCFQHETYTPLDCENFEEILHTNLYSNETTTFIFPNPAHNTIQINSPLEITAYRIINMNGMLLKNINNFNEDQQIDLSFLNPGIYIIQIETKELSMQKKLIKLLPHQ